jgi:hypothetical protein
LGGWTPENRKEQDRTGFDWEKCPEIQRYLDIFRNSFNMFL